MDIQYCDKCGEMLQADHVMDPSQLEVLCTTCQGGAAPAAGGMPSDFEVTEDLSLSGVMRDQGLDLFSNDTIAMRRQQKPPAAGDSPGDSKLQLVEEPGADDDGGAGFFDAVMSPTDPSMTSRPAASGPAALSGVSAPQGLQQPAPPPATPTPAAAPSSPAAPPGPRLKVHCVHCNAKLSLPPVTRRSKLRCPRCTEVLVVNPDGQVMAPNPGSVAIPKGNEELARFATNDPTPSLSGTHHPYTGGPAPENSPMVPYTGGPVDLKAPAPPSHEAHVPVVNPAELGATDPFAEAFPDSAGGSPMGHTTTAPAPAFDPLPSAPPMGAPAGGGLPAMGDLTLDQALSQGPTPLAPGQMMSGLAHDEPVAAALLPTPKPPKAARMQIPHGLPAENLVLWLLITAFPTFTGLILASDVMGTRVGSMLMVIGESVRGTVAGLYQALGG